jgi:hypothetical protein
MLFHAIRAYNLIPGPSLAEQMFANGFDCYVGMRSRKEFEGSRSSFHTVVWVNASQRKPYEGEGSMELRPWDADVRIHNNNDLESLRLSVERLATEYLGLARTSNSTYC